MAPFPRNNSNEPSAASASGRSGSPAGWCCLPIWSAISSTMRSAIFRWMRWPSASAITSLFWQFLPVAIVFYTAALVHAGLGIWALYERRQFRWKAIEPMQLVLGLSIPALIIAHITGVRLGETLFGHEKLYPQVFYAYWVAWPYKILHDVRGAADRLDPRLHRSLLLAADEGVLQARGAVSARRGDADSDAGHARPLSGRTKRRRRQRQTSRMAGGQSFAAARSARAAEQDMLESIVEYFLIGYFGLLGLVLLARGVRALARAARRHDQFVLRQWQDGSGAEGPERARGEPAQQRPACQRLRRPRPLLDLPHSRDRRLQRAAGAVGARGLRAQPRRRGLRSVDPSCLPAPARDRSFLLPDVHAADDGGQRRTTSQSAPHRPGALSRQHVRRHARLDQACGKPPAVRYRLHRQSLPRRGVAGRDRMRRPAQPVRRRRTIGAVRARDQSADRLPPGAARRRR